MRGVLIGLIWLRIGKVESSCEYGNEPSGSHKLLGGSRVAAQPVASRVVVSSTELVQLIMVVQNFF
jgi:hypothetical protein